MLLADRLAHHDLEAPFLHHRPTDRRMPLGHEAHELAVEIDTAAALAGSHHDVEVADAVQESGQKDLVGRNAQPIGDDLANRGHGDALFPQGVQLLGDRTQRWLGPELLQGEGHGHGLHEVMAEPRHRMAQIGEGGARGVENHRVGGLQNAGRQARLGAGDAHDVIRGAASGRASACRTRGTTSGKHGKLSGPEPSSSPSFCRNANAAACPGLESGGGAMASGRVGALASTNDFRDTGGFSWAIFGEHPLIIGRADEKLCEIGLDFRFTPPIRCVPRPNRAAPPLSRPSPRRAAGSPRFPRAGSAHRASGAARSRCRPRRPPPARSRPPRSPRRPGRAPRARRHRERCRGAPHECAGSPRASSDRKVDEEDLVEAALADQFGRQRRDVVRGGHHEHAALLFRQPREEGAQHAARRAAVRIAGAEALFDLVDPQHAGRQQIRRAQRLAQVALGLAHVLVEQRRAIEPQEGHVEDARTGALPRGSCRNPALRAAGFPSARRAAAPSRRTPGSASPASLSGSQAADVGKMRGFVLVAQDALPVQQVVLRAHHHGHIRSQDGAVIENGLARQALRIGGG